MTNEEQKARELVDKFYKCMPFRDTKLTSCDGKPELIKEMELLSAKQCAIICVDEIMKRIPFVSSKKEDFDTLAELRAPKEDFLDFWQSVRTNIEQLNT